MDLLSQLHQGNTRANRDFIADWVGSDQSRMKELMEVYLRGDTREAQLAAGVLFCTIENDPSPLSPWLPKILKRMDEPGVHPAVRRAGLKLLMSTDIPRQSQGRAVDACFRYLSDMSQPIAIRVFAMGSILRIARSEPGLKHELEETVKALLPYGTAAFRAHAKRVLKKEVIENVDLSSRRRQA